MGRFVRYALVGCGLMGVEHVHNLKALVRLQYELALVAIADPHAPSIDAALQAAAPSFEPKVYVDYENMLEDCGAELDVLVVATPNFHHRTVLLHVLPRYPKLHVLCEKPMCTTVEDCKLVADAARNREGILWIGLEYRYMPPVTRLLADVAAGKIGRLRMMSIREHRFPFLQKVANWNRFSENTGGTLVEKCCHFFDLLNELNGGRAPVSVFADGARNVNHELERYDGRQPDILDNAYVTLMYDNGVRGLVDLCMFADATQNQEELVAVGDEGKLEAFLPSHEFRTGIRGRDWIGKVECETVEDARVVYAGHHYGSSQLEHMELYDCVACDEGRTGPRVTLQNGLISVAVGVAAQLSIEKQRVIYLSEVLDPAYLSP